MPATGTSPGASSSPSAELVQRGLRFALAVWERIDPGRDVREAALALAVPQASHKMFAEAPRTAVGAALHHVAIAAGVVLVGVYDTGRVAVVSRSGRLLDQIKVGAGPHGIDVLPADG